MASCQVRPLLEICPPTPCVATPLCTICLVQDENPSNPHDSGVVSEYALFTHVSVGAMMVATFVKGAWLPQAWSGQHQPCDADVSLRGRGHGLPGLAGGPGSSRRTPSAASSTTAPSRAFLVSPGCPEQALRLSCSIL